MPIILHLDDIAKKRGYSVQELSDAVGISRVNMSRSKNGNVRAIRFSTLESLCDILDCQPGDLIEFVRYFKDRQIAPQGYRGQEEDALDKAGAP